MLINFLFYKSTDIQYIIFGDLFCFFILPMIYKLKIQTGPNLQIPKHIAKLNFFHCC